jgi:hypothetical protein
MDLRAYASAHVIFTELCPYASESFSLKPHEVSDLAHSDPAFQTAAQIRSILIEQAQPALVLINGGSALQPFELAYRDYFTWELARKEYPSCDQPAPGRASKMLWHQEGIYTSPNGPTPIIGFPFLRKPRHHNSYAEIAQLGEHARQWRASVTRQPSA